MEFPLLIKKEFGKMIPAEERGPMDINRSLGIGYGEGKKEGFSVKSPLCQRDAVMPLWGKLLSRGK